MLFMLRKRVGSARIVLIVSLHFLIAMSVIQCSDSERLRVSIDHFLEKFKTCKACGVEAINEWVFFAHYHKGLMVQDRYCSMACFMRDRNLDDGGWKGEDSEL